MKAEDRVTEADMRERIKGLILALFPPPKLVADIHQRRRVQLVAVISLVTSVYLLAGLLLSLNWISAHGVFLVVSIPTYLISRTKYNGVASIIFAFGGLIYLFLSINLGSTPNLESAVVPWLILWLIAAGTILSPIVLAIYGLTATFLTFGAPYYASASAVDGDATRLGYVVLSISFILYILRLYHDYAVDARLHQLEEENRELERTRLDLELHLGVQTIDLNDRSQEISMRFEDLESANRRLEHQAVRFEALRQAVETLTTRRNDGELLAEFVMILGQNFNFDHVGIYLMEKQGEYAILKAAYGEVGVRMLSENHRVKIGQTGAIGQAAAIRQPWMIPNTKTDPISIKDPDLLPDTCSELTIPIMGMVDTQIIGVLDIQSTNYDAFSIEDHEFLKSLAFQIGLAIENSLLRESSDQETVQAESHTDRSPYREDWNRFTAVQQPIGYRFDITGTSRLAEPIAHTDLDSGKVEDNTDDYFGVPIELRGEVLGELLVHAPDGKTWNEDELDLIRAVAERVALSAENARLFEEANRRAERERTVSEITAKIRSTNDPNEMVKKAVQELKNALGVSRVEVRPQKTSNSNDVFKA